MTERLVDRLVRGGLSLAWKVVSGLAWSAPFVGAVGAMIRRVPSSRTYRVRYKNTYLYATSFDRFIALNLWKYRVIEGHELRLAESLIRPGMHILDIGANVGFHSLEFARWTGPSGKIDAFEPAPENYAVLKRNIETSGLRNITAYELAISNTVGQTLMYLSPAHRGDHRIVESGDRRASIRVNTATVDCLYGDTNQRVDFVKIDAQGAEYLVLAGMREVVRNNPDITVMIEFCPGLMSKSGHSPEEFIVLLGSLDRRIRVLDHHGEECLDCDRDTLRRRAASERQIDLLLTAR